MTKQIMSYALPSPFEQIVEITAQASQTLAEFVDG
jgi:hypothetical protein